jgi:hypothetical protein
MTKPAKTLTRFQRAKAIARLGAYVSFVLVVLAVLAARSVYASAVESSMGLGRELGKLGDVMTSTKKLSINGQTMFVSTAGTDQSVTVVLDRFEAMCAEHAAAMSEELARLPEAMKAAITKGSRAAGLGIVRKEHGDEEGIVACFANDEAGGSSSITARVTKLLETGDLSSMGRLRYVHASKTKKGGTHVVAVWTDGSVKLGEMFPKEGDAKGNDSNVAPRPGDAKRLLAAQVEGAPYALRVYESAMSVDAYYAELDAKMKDAGWTRILSPNGSKAHGFVNGSGVEIVANADADGAKTLVTITELGRSDEVVTQERR